MKLNAEAEGIETSDLHRSDAKLETMTGKFHQYKGSVYIVCFSGIHSMQAEYLKRRLENVKTIGPSALHSDIPFPEGFRADTFASVAKSNFIEELVELARKEHCRWLWITCLNLPFSNMLARALANTTDARIVIYYDGLMNLVNARMTHLERVKDAVKYLYAKRHKKRFVRRNQYVNGCDLDVIDHFVYPPFLYYREAFFEKETAWPSADSDDYEVGAVQVTLVLSLLNSAIGAEADKILRNTIEECRRLFPDHEVRILTKPGAPVLPEYQSLEVPRLNDRESAEDVVWRLQPNVVVSQVSSALVNLRIAGFQGSIFSCRLEEYFQNFQAELEPVIRNIFERFEIKILS